jgi:glycosyltransferase involved in cell wall biosynthesis
LCALILYLDTLENDEVAAGVGIPFTHRNLTETLERALRMPEAEREEYRRRAVERVRERYSWDRVTDAYEALFTKLAGR